MTEHESELIEPHPDPRVRQVIEQEALTREFLDMTAKHNFRKQVLMTVVGLTVMVIAVMVGFELKESSDERGENAKILTASQEDTDQAVDKLNFLVDGLIELRSAETSQQSAANLAETLRVVLEHADCDNREVVQQLAEELVEAGIFQEDDLQLRCPFDPPPIPGATTTSVPG